MGFFRETIIIHCSCALQSVSLVDHRSPHLPLDPLVVRKATPQDPGKGEACCEVGSRDVVSGHAGPILKGGKVTKKPLGWNLPTSTDREDCFILKKCIQDSQQPKPKNVDIRWFFRHEWFFFGGRFFVKTPTGSPWFLFGIGKWKCTKSNPPILNTRGKPPWSMAGKYREKMHLTQKFQLKNSPTTKISRLFAWPFQPLQTTWWKPPNYTEAPKPPWVPHPSRQAVSGTEKHQRGESLDVTAVSKKNGKMVVWPIRYVFVVRRFCYWKKRAATAMTLVEVNKKNHYKEKASNFQSIPIQV